MSWYLELRTENQYGNVPLERARPRVVERTLTQVLVRSLFGANAEAGAATLQRLAARFGAHLETLATRNWKVIALWEQVKSQAAREGGDASVVRAWAEPLYCHGLHTLCCALVSGFLGHREDAVSAPQAEAAQAVGHEGDIVALDEEAQVPETAAAEASYDERGPSCWMHELRDALALRLARLPGPVAQDLAPEGGTVKEVMQFAAQLVIEALLSHLPEALAIDREPHRLDGPEGPRTFVRLVVRSNEISRRLEEIARALPLRLTLQPLAEPPVYARTRTEAGILVGYRRFNRFLSTFHERFEAGEDFVHAVNAQQAVRWRINLDLLQVALHVAGLAHPEKQWTEATTQAVSGAGLAGHEIRAWREWSRREFYRPVADDARRRNYLKPGELLDHVLARESLVELAHAIDDGAQPVFFLPWMADYRGRIYARTPWLTPQGGDLQRALLEFAEGSPLDEHGAKALKRHGANLVKRGRLLADLGIDGRDVVTLQERERWVDAHEEDILASAREPLKHIFWREASEDEPMQFLAFCFAYCRWKETPGEPIHVPVQIDGTCNGLQHIAALTGDRALAHAVNVLPRQDGLPGDIYSEVAKHAQRLAERYPQRLSPLAQARRRRTKPFEENELEEEVTTLAAKLVGEVPWPRWIARDTAKKAVMTVPYGASPGSQACDVLEKITGRLDAVIARFIGAGTLGAQVRELGVAVQVLQERFPDSRLRTFLARARHRLRKQMRELDADSALYELDRRVREYLKSDKAKFAPSPEPGSSSANACTGREEDWQDWLGIAALSACIAREIVLCLRESLAELYPGVKAFGRWLDHVGQCCASLPLVWFSPAGFPVCQDKFREQRSSLNARLGGQAISIGITRLTEEVSSSEQQRALLPNLIHSLDATHLVMTINAAHAAGIDRFGSIHDCLLCHPNDAHRLAQILRESFATLYVDKQGGGPAVLSDWAEWMSLLAALANTEQASTLLGALQHAQGLGEQLLQAFPDHRANALLARIRACDAQRRGLAEALLQFRIGPEFRAGSRRSRPARWTAPPRSEGFAIGEVRESAYFFS